MGISKLLTAHWLFIDCAAWTAFFCSDFGRKVWWRELRSESVREHQMSREKEKWTLLFKVRLPPKCFGKNSFVLFALEKRGNNEHL